MGMFALFILGQYLSRQNNSVEKLGCDQIMSINRNVKLWLGETMPSTECRFARHVCFTFNFRCKPLSVTERKELTNLSQNFLEWLDAFVAKNNINFPYIEKFFGLLIYNSLQAIGYIDNYYEDCKDDYLNKTCQYIEGIFERSPKYFGDQTLLSSAEVSSSLSDSYFEFKGTIEPVEKQCPDSPDHCYSPEREIKY
jgi:hypothetical protein